MKGEKLTWILLSVAFIAVVGFMVLPGLLESGCIVEGTLIATPDGDRPIENLRVGDRVWTQGPRGREVGRVEAVHPGWATTWVEIGDLRATPTHPVAVGTSWVPAGRLPGIRTRHALVQVFDLQVAPHPNFFAGGRLVHNKSSNERNAQSTLKSIASGLADYRMNDRDGNRINDFWVGDVAELYFQEDESGDPIKQIERSVARADVAPFRAREEIVPKANYLYAVIPFRSDGTLYADRNLRNLTGFAICAWPARYKENGANTLIISEGNTVYKKDRGDSGRVLQWPADPEAEGWRKFFD